MGSPFTAPQNLFSHPKPLTNTTFHNPNNTPQFCYEPTSVLDLRRSPSPVVGVSDSVTPFTGIMSDNTPLHWDDEDDHALHWDHSMILGLEDEEDQKDDSIHPFKNLPQFCPQTFEPQIPNHHPHQNLDSFHPSSSPFLSTDFNSNCTQSNLEFDCAQLEQLIRAAASVESNDLHLAQVLLARLNQQLSAPSGKPLQRSAFYFKEVLQLLVSASGATISLPNLSNSDVIQKIKAYKAFTDISPITMFANFTANQALLEALDGAMFIHVIDFDIGLGGHWASFLQEIASKAKSRNGQPCSIRITAVIPDESSLEAKLIRDNLQQFAQELGIQFQLYFVFCSSFEHILFNSIRFINGEVIAVNLSPSIFHRLRTSDSIAGFLRFLRQISPRVTVFVDEEGCRDNRASSFRKNFINGLEFYSCLMESLDAANSGDGDVIRRIERFLLRPKIAGSVAAAAANCILPWREMLASVGMLPVQFSEFTDCQAEWLVRRTQVRGFHVAKRQGVMLLCWHERELVATSAWRCQLE